MLLIFGLLRTPQLRSQCIKRYTALHLLRLLHLGVVHNHRLALYVPWLSCLQKIHDKCWFTWFVLTSCPRSVVGGVNLGCRAREAGGEQCQGGRRNPWGDAPSALVRTRARGGGTRRSARGNKSRPARRNRHWLVDAAEFLGKRIKQVMVTKSSAGWWLYCALSLSPAPSLLTWI